jgi:hypothetical protein
MSASSSSSRLYFPSSPSSLSSSSSTQSPDLSEGALENCIDRILEAVQQVELGIQNKLLSKLDCLTTMEFPENPLVANCGHIFERATLQRWKDQGGDTCGLCRTPITQVIPVSGLREFVLDRLPKDFVPTCSEEIDSNPEREDLYLQLAKSFMKEENYKKALKSYGKVLRYTHSSEIYANIPQLYERLKKFEKARLSHLHLSIYQLQEGKIQEAIETLRRCESKDVNIDPLIVGLALNLDSSSENIAWALSVASKQGDPSDKMFIYQQIIAQAPNLFEAYAKIIRLTKDPVEKRDLCIKTADLAHEAQLFDLEATFRAEAEIPPAPTVISTSEWENAQTVNLPPYYLELQKFLSEDCTIWPGKKRSETHIVVPLFPEAAIEDAAPTPLTLESLEKLDKSAGGPGYRCVHDQIPKNLSSGKEFHYAVMTKDVIPGSRNKSYEDQLKLLPEGYEAPPGFGAALALLWENRRSGERLFSNDPLVYTHCEDVIKDGHLFVGGFAPDGLCVSHCYAHGWVGIAGWREF